MPATDRAARATRFPARPHGRVLRIRRNASSRIAPLERRSATTSGSNAVLGTASRTYGVATPRGEAAYARAHDPGTRPRGRIRAGYPAPRTARNAARTPLPVRRTRMPRHTGICPYRFDIQTCEFDIAGSARAPELAGAGSTACVSTERKSLAHRNV